MTPPPHPVPSVAELMQRFRSACSYQYMILKTQDKRLKASAQERFDAEADALESELSLLVASNDRMTDALLKLESWCRAYPIDLFPPPDFKRAHEVLEAAGISLGAISAANMRHVTQQAMRIVDEAMTAPPTSKEPAP